MSIYTLEEEVKTHEYDGERLLDKYVLAVYKDEELAQAELKDRLKELQDINHERGEATITWFGEHDATLAYDDGTTLEVYYIERVIH